jgi:hypothetical protein
MIEMEYADGGTLLQAIDRRKKDSGQLFEESRVLW